jgi:bile acid-coenzyme A ligase
LRDIFAGIKEVAARTPGAIATVSRFGHLHYEAFWRNVESIAYFAIGQGIRPGNVVAIRTDHHDARLQIYLALMRIGCRVGITQTIGLFRDQDVPLDALITDDPRLTNSGAKKFIPLTPAWFKPPTYKVRSLPEGERFSLIFNSSGSTGMGKLLEMSDVGLDFHLEQKLNETYRGDELRFLNAAGPSATNAFLEYVATLWRGGMTIFPHDRSGAAVLDAIQLHRPTYALIPPATLIETMKAQEQRPGRVPKVGIIRLTGAYCAPEHKRKALELIAERVATSYGASEVGNMALGFFDPQNDTDRVVGKVRDHIEIVAFDESGNPLPSGSVGEIRVKHPPGVLSTYPGKSGQGRVGIKDGWFLPGDTGSVDAEGYLTLEGRSNSIINLGGNKVDPEAVEAVIAQYAGIQESGVAGIPGEDGVPRIHAAIVSKDAVDLYRLNAFITRKNPQFSVHKLIPVPSVPRTETGKIDRPALLEMVRQAGT